MSEQTIINIISSLLSVIAVLGLVIKIMLDKRSNGNNPDRQSNHQKRIDDNLADGTKTLASKFDEQVSNCNRLWMGYAKFEGRMEQYMIEIRDKLDKINKGGG